MPVTPTYPGIYIEELPFGGHTIQAAPTSIAAFIGYVNPWQTASAPGVGFSQPVGSGASATATAATAIYSFADYQRAFGGMFSSGLVDPSLPRAVYQFFANGGSQAYVVGLLPRLYDTDGDVVGSFLDDAAATVIAPSKTAGRGLVFTARQFTDRVKMRLTISNLRKGVSSAFDTFDLVISYGGAIETYRGLTIGASVAADESNAAWTIVNARSTLARLSPMDATAGSAGYGAELDAPQPPQTMTREFAATLPANFNSCFKAADFVAQMQAQTSLDQVETFNLLLLPGVADLNAQSAALSFAEAKLAFAILDPPQTATLSGQESGLKIDDFASQTLPRGQNGALYFPWLKSTDPVTGDAIEIAPSGSVAGIYAKTDVSRGVWKAPAGMATTILNTSGPAPGGVMTDAQQGELNMNQAVNCLRQFASIGTVVFGSRTLVATNDAYAQSKYVPVRRMTLFLEQTLRANLRWVVFEPNDAPLWSAITLTIETFLLGLWNQGALQGSKPSQAFQVICDSSTTTPADQQNGVVNIVVAFAPLKPAEFVVIKIAQLAGQAAT